MAEIVVNDGNIQFLFISRYYVAVIQWIFLSVVNVKVAESFLRFNSFIFLENGNRHLN